MTVIKIIKYKIKDVIEPYVHIMKYINLAETSYCNGVKNMLTSMKMKNSHAYINAHTHTQINHPSTKFFI